MQWGTVQREHRVQNHHQATQRRPHDLQGTTTILYTPKIRLRGFESHLVQTFFPCFICCLSFPPRKFRVLASTDTVFFFRTNSRRKLQSGNTVFLKNGLWNNVIGCDRSLLLMLVSLGICINGVMLKWTNNFSSSQKTSNKPLKKSRSTHPMHTSPSPSSWSPSPSPSTFRNTNTITTAITKKCWVCLQSSFAAIVEWSIQYTRTSQPLPGLLTKPLPSPPSLTMVIC